MAVIPLFSRSIRSIRRASHYTSLAKIDIWAALPQNAPACKNNANPGSQTMQQLAMQNNNTQTPFSDRGAWS
jgi:hypothetical protein